jgi:hypothetical protein
VRQNLVISVVLVLVLLIGTVIYQNDLAGEAFIGLQQKKVVQVEINVQSTADCDVQAWVKNSHLKGDKLLKATIKLCPDLLKKIRVSLLYDKLLGDVDGSGRVTSKDAELIIDSLIHSTGLLREQFSIGDVDKSGFVDYKDIAEIIHGSYSG